MLPCMPSYTLSLLAYAPVFGVSYRLHLLPIGNTPLPQVGGRITYGRRAATAPGMKLPAGLGWV